MLNLKIINEKYAITKLNKYEDHLHIYLIIFIYDKKNKYKYIINPLNWVFF